MKVKLWGFTDEETRHAFHVKIAQQRWRKGEAIEKLVQMVVDGSVTLPAK